MSCKVRVDYKELVEFQAKLNKLQQKEIRAFCERVSKLVAAQLLAIVIPTTPVGQYPKESGKVGGTLKRGWTGGKESNGFTYAATLPVSLGGLEYTIVVKNPVHYASYVEFGHRTRGGKGFVEGKFFMRKAQIKVEAILPKLIEQQMKTFLKSQGII